MVTSSMNGKKITYNGNDWIYEDGNIVDMGDVNKKAENNSKEFKIIDKKIEYAADKAGITKEQAIKFMDSFEDVKN